MRAIVTCGPTFEPIDDVRRITNFATGEIGTILCDALARAGWNVHCLRGEMATHPALPVRAEVESFSTTADLCDRLLGRAASGGADCIFHAAAVSDYAIDPASRGSSRKTPTSGGGLTLKLVPTPKILPRLRPAFPRAAIVGWKYELDGTRAKAIARGAAQIEACGTDACVVNGAAYGPGFGILTPDGCVAHVEGKPALAGRLVEWLRGRLNRR